MSLMTRVKVIGTLITLAIAAGVIASYDEWGRPDPSSDVNELVTVHVQFSPNRPSRPIDLQVLAEGATLHTDKLKTSPWDRGFQVPKGTVVTVILNQPSAGTLICRVDRPNRLGEPGSRETTGQLKCSG